MLTLLAIILLSDKSSAFEHDISANNFNSPAPYDRMPINISEPVSCNFTNNGTSDETQVKLFVLIENQSGSLLYKDSVIISSWKSRVNMDVSFKDFTPAYRMSYKVIGFCALATDENTGNDTIAFSVYVNYQSDAAAIAILQPELDEVELEHNSFKIIGTFQDLGYTDCYDLPVKVLITRCFDNELVFESDTILPEMYVDSPAVQITFPSGEGAYHVSNLAPGCYNIAIISNMPDDGDRTNDTARSSFTVVQNMLSHDIALNAIVSPPVNLSQPLDRPIHISCLFRNTGASTESNVILNARIKNVKGDIVYTDSVIQNNWGTNKSFLATFRDFSAPANGQYTITAFSALPNDLDRSNDTLSSVFTVGNSCDVSAVSVFFPYTNEKFPVGFGFVPSGVFQWRGDVNNTMNITISLFIRDCNSNMFFQFDSIIPHSEFTNGPFTIALNSPIVKNAIVNLPEGCYILNFVSQLSCDTDPFNDTSEITFTVGGIQNDISVEKYISPIAQERMLIDTLLPIICRIRNLGLRDEYNTEVISFIVNSDSNVVYRDTIIFPLLQHNGYIDSSFKPFVPRDIGKYQCCTISLLDDDEFRRDDTLWCSFIATKNTDVQAISVIFPAPNAVLPEGEEFQPLGNFLADYGLSNVFNVPVSCHILQSGTNNLVFSSDTIIPVLYTESTPVIFPFPVQQGNYDIRALPSGFYKLELIASNPIDIDRRNDTAYTNFSIFSHADVSAGTLENNFTLKQNYPNPFSSMTSISLSLPHEAIITLKVFDQLGNQVSSLASGHYESGTYYFNWDGSHMPAGVYYYRLQAGEYSMTRGLVLEK